MRTAFVALSILFASFWVASLAAFDSDWTILEPGEMLMPQKGLTTQKSPTIYVEAWGDPTGMFAIRFSLVDARSMRPVAEVPLHFEAHLGARLQRIRLGDSGIELEEDVDYRWYISKIPTPDFPMPEEIARERRKLTEGEIVRTAPKNLHFYGRSCEKDNVRGLADAGFWYDSFDCVNELLEANPQDRTLRYLRGELLGKCRDPFDGMPLGPCDLKYGPNPRSPRYRP